MSFFSNIVATCKTRAALFLFGTAIVGAFLVKRNLDNRRRNKHPLTIVKVDLWHVRGTLPAPFYPSWIPGFAQEENRFDLIRLRTASGIEGWSAAPCMGTERAGFGALLGSYFLGERADDLENVRQRIREMSYLGYRAGWIEPACWDIVGKARNKPVYALLREAVTRGYATYPSTSRPPNLDASGKTFVKLYASTGEVRTGIEAANVVKARVTEGFDAVKLRVHDWTLEEDIAQIQTCREIVGNDVVLGVDCNQAWRVSVIADAPKWGFSRALKFVKEADRLGYSWVEEPLPMDAYHDLSRFRNENLKVQITGGELNNYGIPEFKVMATKYKAYDVYQPDAIMVGGIAEVWAIMHLVTSVGAQYSPHTWTNGIGFAVNLQIFAASPCMYTKRLEYPLDLPGWTVKGRDALLKKSWDHEKGKLELPTAPGLGFEIDHGALRRHGKHFYSGSPIRVAIRTVLERGVAAAKRLGATRERRLSQRSLWLSLKEQEEGYDPMLDHLNVLVREVLHE